MDDITSVSKGVFVFPNGFKSNDKILKKSKSIQRKKLRPNELWYTTYNILWNRFESKIQEMNETMFSKLLSSIIYFIKNSNSSSIESIPTAAVLTGINLPDHGAIFHNLNRQIHTEITDLVVTLHSDECTTLKSIMENLVYQLIQTSSKKIDNSDNEDEPIIKKSQCTFAALAEWYASEISWTIHKSPKKKMKAIRNKKKIVIILPDFESLHQEVLQDLILILGSYLHTLPFILIFGVATSLDVVHRSLPFKVSSKLSIEVFQAEQSITYLNSILENVFLNENTRFYLTGKPFTLLTDIFLFYDFSVNGFIQGLKFAFLDHCYENNIFLLSCSDMEMSIDDILANFTHEDCENIRQLNSFRPYLEAQSKENIIKLFEDDKYFKMCVKRKVNELFEYLAYFHTFLKCLHSLMSSLPKHPLGKQLREFYATAVSTSITMTTEYKECLQLLNFLSKDELLTHISKIHKILMQPTNNTKEESIDLSVIQTINLYSTQIKNASFSPIENDSTVNDIFDSKLNRIELKQKLLEISKQQRKVSEFDRIRNVFLNYLTTLFEKYLKPPNTQTFYEIFFYNDISSLKSHIIGSSRAAIHTALNNPHFYLQCSCCEIEDSHTILPSMPDISIIYKLHLECGKLINLYDWLQAFLTILDPEGYSDDQQRVLPELQARFTRAVAELQFLGFIKSSKRKTDHVQRLTWGGS